ncbi:MAG: DUF2461 domain-containing protein [Acidimicrobiia bacterium]|nr:DUF2461 domain-containing protein [Acidimicrobiia bacterium]
MTRHFTPATFAFLRDLAANNDRQWFATNKDRYIEKVQEPALEFITDFGPRLQKISPHFTADARVVGGSLFRIQRDTRFSKDKTPYKQNTGVQFRHEAAKDAHAPGFYLHLEPSGSFMGVGLWRPETAVAYQIRHHIAEHPDDWKRATRSRKFRATFELGGDALVNPPKGFDADHPLVDDLKRKDFIASTPLSQKTITSDGFIDEFTALCRTATPFMRFLCDATGVPF